MLRGDVGQPHRAGALLRSLGWDAAALAAGRRRDLALALAFASRFERVFSVSMPDAPRVALVGATVDPGRFGLGAATHDVSGKSPDAGEAFLGCVGEAVEYLSMQTWGDEAVEIVPREHLDERLAEPFRDAGVRCLPATALATGAAGWMPADLCLRPRNGGDPRWTRSGFGAGPTFRDAATAAVLELVERDAVALWWISGRPARAVSSEMVLEAMTGLPEGALSGRDRLTTLVDITTDVGIPVVLSFSIDPDHSGFACGAAARPTLPGAAAAAFLEMAQMEFALRLAREGLRSRGEEALNEVERRHLRRAGIAVGEAPAMPRPLGLPASAGRPDDRPLAERLGVDCWLVDLTRGEIGIPCVRAVAPDLQTYPVATETRRLRAGGTASSVVSLAVELM